MRFNKNEFARAVQPPTLRNATCVWLASVILWAGHLNRDAGAQPPAASESAELAATERLADSSKQAYFRKSIVPILATRCLICHGGESVEGGYSVSIAQAVLLPGESELAPVVPGDQDASELLRRLMTGDDDERMPAEAEPLSAEDIESFRQWIASGATIAAEDLARPLIELREFSESRWQAPVEYGQPLAIQAIALAADNESVFVAGYSEVLQWSWANSGELKQRIRVAGPHIASLAVAAATRQLVVSSGVPGEFGQVQAFQLEPTLSSQLLLQTGDISPSVCVAPDGSRVAIAGFDGVLSVGRLNGDLGFGPIRVEQWTPHADSILAIAWSPNGQHLLTASRDRTAKFFDATRTRVMANYDKHERAVGGVAFANAGPLSLDETGRLRLWAGDNSDGLQTDHSNLPRKLQPLVAIGDELFLTDANRIRRLIIEKRKVQVPRDEKQAADKSEEPKSKTVVKIIELESLVSRSTASLTSIAVNERVIAAGDAQGQVWLWKRERQPEHAGQSVPKLITHFLARP